MKKKVGTVKKSGKKLDQTMNQLGDTKQESAAVLQQQSQRIVHAIGLKSQNQKLKKGGNVAKSKVLTGAQCRWPGPALMARQTTQAVLQQSQERLRRNLAYIELNRYLAIKAKGKC